MNKYIHPNLGNNIISQFKWTQLKLLLWLVSICSAKQVHVLFLVKEEMYELFPLPSLDFTNSL